EKAATQIAPRDIEVALAKVRASRKLTLAHLPIGWAGNAYPFRDPLDFLGHDGGAGLSAGPGLTVGVALALKGSGRPVVSVMGDGDFLQGATALWTAARYQLPALFIVNNNRSNYNDEIHQEAVARMRGRPVENRWIGQRINDPAPDLAGIARAQGLEAEGPVGNVPDLERAIERGLASVAAGKPYLIDAHVTPGYANMPAPRGE
ncbi:MAG: thiamine pyrophosphate-binding protein, partial [Betaproteobacteria bacterium]|nr:thiamine pyrophosphate-binding protein [Betaproteobacteria bacterium]